jgi:predicted dehydrogenase
MKKKYALVGTGGRAEFFYGALAEGFRDRTELVAFCDINAVRLSYANRLLKEKYAHPEIAVYGADEFDAMIEKEKPDTIIVTTMDRTHHKYIIRAMELGCDVISEKPMTVDEDKCQEILDAVNRTGRNLRVTFNYRYAPHNTKVRELIMDGVIGDVHSVHFEWLLSTEHGADYFRRWHRDKRNSGGLLVHKSTHHFDLVNFWLGTRPQSVFAMGGLMYYGRENALGVIVRYENQAILTYSLNAYQPWEGFNVVFNGSKGRMELKVVERSYINSAGEKEDEGALSHKQLTVQPLFQKAYEVEIEERSGGHGGGDPILLNDLFGEPAPDRLNRAASHVDGAISILTGIAGNVSMRTGRQIEIEKLVKF